MASKVLLVEDDNNLREIYEARLQAEGYTIATAKDGEEALVVAKAEKPDLIISDVMMPRISGFEMLDILRNTDELKYTKVIMLTALGQAEDKTRADSLGADRYLVKSQVTLEDIVKAAHELTDGPIPAAAPAATVAEPIAPQPMEVAPAPTTPVQAAPAEIQMATPPAVTPAPVPSAPITPAPAQIAPQPPVTQLPVVSQPAAVPLAMPPAQPAPVLAPVAPVPPPNAIPDPVISAPVAPAVSEAAQSNPAVVESLPQASPTMPVDTPVEPVASPSPEPAVPLPVQARPDFMTDYSSAGTRSTAESTSQPEAPQASVKTERPAAIINAASTAEEEATVGAQIADFASAPAPVAAPVTPPDAVAASHDAVLATAVNGLSGTAPQPSGSVTVPDSVPDVSQTSVPDTKPVDNASTASGNVTIANKKVIHPIMSGPKPNINDLLAREEAKNTATDGLEQVVTPAQTATPNSEPTPPISTTGSMPTVPPAVTQTSPDFDPNNIAL